MVPTSSSIDPSHYPAATVVATASTTADSANTTLLPTSNPSSILTPSTTTTATARPITTTTTPLVTAAASTRPLPAAQLRPRPPGQQIPIYPDQLRPLYPAFPSQTLPSHPQLAKPSTDGIRYSVASSGRGFVAARQPQFPDQRATVVVPVPVAGHPPPRSLVGYPPPPPASLTGRFPRGIGYGGSDSIQLLRPQQPSNFPSARAVSLAGPQAVKGIPFTVHHTQPKVASSQGLVPDPKDPNDRDQDDTFVMVRGRKVKISDKSSMYALCRSWLRNGVLEESQPQFAEVVKSLPKPPPVRVSDSNSPKGHEADEEDEDEDEKSVEDMSEKELLQKHIKRAKRVHARLREERLQRIRRYKSRLALLLPPLVEQVRNDANSGI